MLDQELPALLGADPGLLGREGRLAAFPTVRELVPCGHRFPEGLLLQGIGDRPRAGQVGKRPGVGLQGGGQLIRAGEAPVFRMIRDGPGDGLFELDFQVPPIEAAADRLESFRQVAGPVLGLVAGQVEVRAEVGERLLGVGRRAEDRRLIGRGRSRAEGIGLLLDLGDLPGDLVEAREHGLLPLALLGLEIGGASADQGLHGGFLAVEPGQRAGGLDERGRLRREGCGLGVPHGLVEPEGPVGFLALGHLDALADLDQAGIFQELGVGRFELLEQPDRVVELAELEHVADRGGRAIGLLGSGTAAEGRVDQGAGHEDADGGRGGDRAEPPGLRRLGGMEPRDVAMLEPFRHGVAVADDRMSQLLELGGSDRAGIIERPDQVGDGRFMLLAEPAAFFLVVEPFQGRADPLRDRVIMPELHGGREPGPFLSREPAPDGVAGVERRVEPVRDLFEDGATALVAVLGVGLAQRLHEGAGRRFDPAGLLDFRREPADRLDVVMPDGLGRLFLDLEEPDRLERAQVVRPDRVPRVLRGQLAQHVDSRPERGTLQGQPSMTAEQILERILLGIGRVEPTSQVDRQRRRGREVVHPDQVVPFVPLGEIERRDRVEKLRLGLGELDGLGAQPLLQEPVAPSQPLIGHAAGRGVIGRQPGEPAVLAVVARLQYGADLVDDLVVVHHALGQWSVVSGQWSVVSGRYRMIHCEFAEPGDIKDR